MELSEFLLARIDEDEEAARETAGWDKAGSKRASGRWQRNSASSVVDDENRLIVFGDGPSPSPDQADHIARWDPARVLAEVGAKRQIVDRWQETAPPYADSRQQKIHETLTEVLPYLAAVYSDHPDYDPEWTP